MSKINVLELVDSFGYAGTQRAVINFCKYLDKNIFNVFACAYNEGGAREKELTSMGVEFLVADNNVETILNFIQSKNINIIHFHRSGHFVPIQYEIIKRIKSLSSQIVIIETNIFGKFDKLSYPYIDVSLQISRMMLNERYVRDAGFFDYNKMRVLYYPIDMQGFDNIMINAEEIAQYKNQHSIGINDFVIGKLGRPDVAKWDDLILEMMPYLIKIVPNIKLVIQSAPASRVRAIANSNLKDYIILLEPTTDDRQIALFYNALDVYVHASKIGESFGMTLAEAGIFAKPVIVNSTPKRDNNQVELIDNMKTGIIANKPQTFARAIAFLRKNSEIGRAMGENARDKIRAVYDAAHITKQLEKIFIEQLVKKKTDIDSSVIENYNNINSNPTEQEIVDYRVEYDKRANCDFGRLSWLELIINVLHKPKKFYIKILDFLEHRFKIII